MEAVLSAGTSRDEAKTTTRLEEDNMEDEPQHKRQALGMDFSSLVKVAVLDDQQVTVLS